MHKVLILFIQIFLFESGSSTYHEVGGLNPGSSILHVSEVLQLCSEDAEETLLEMGFGCDEPQVPVRIPPRFFTFPSQAQGINFRLFLDSQLRRIREEDPSLSLASETIDSLNHSASGHRCFKNII
uniref:ITPR-interacting domain-containing protein n=1 Tax=Scophthalmus maximus TaxID=52904 RepID=A0A8D3BV03_SCOMX